MRWDLKKNWDIKFFPYNISYTQILKTYLPYYLMSSYLSETILLCELKLKSIFYYDIYILFISIVRFLWKTCSYLKSLITYCFVLDIIYKQFNSDLKINIFFHQINPTLLFVSETRFWSRRRLHLATMLKDFSVKWVFNEL